MQSATRCSFEGLSKAQGTRTKLLAADGEEVEKGKQLSRKLNLHVLLSDTKFGVDRYGVRDANSSEKTMARGITFSKAAAAIIDEAGIPVAGIKAIHVVHATWCPHCHPTTVEPMEKLAAELGIAFFPYDIDKPEQERKADELVRKFGDWSEDYLIPQVFLETKDGKVRHILTGYSESVELTKRAVSNLINSPYFRGDSSVK